jgi:hypothetical protein
MWFLYLLKILLEKYWYINNLILKQKRQPKFRLPFLFFKELNITLALSLKKYSYIKI